MTFRYAICNETFEEMPWSEAFELARSIGYTGLEVAPFTLGPDAFHISDQRRRELVEAARGADLRVIGLHWLLAETGGYHLTTRHATIADRTVEYLKELVRLCRDLGGGVMVLGSPLQRNFGPEMTHDQASDNACGILSRVVPTLEKHQVRIAIEPLGPQEGNFLNTASQARSLIKQIGSEHVQLHLDVKAMSTEGGPIEEVIRECARELIHFHANDANRLGPGMGEIDFLPIFKALSEIQYRGWISVEVFDYTPGVENILRTSMNTMLSCERYVS